MKTEQYIQALNTYIGQLKAHIIYLEQLGAPAFFELGIDCTALNEDFNWWVSELEKSGITKDTPVLYYFAFEGYKAADILAAAEKRKSDKRHKLKLALPQLNKKNDSNILYVGKCNKNFPSRLRYHLGFGGSATYALNLKHWAYSWRFTLWIAPIHFGEKDKEIHYLEHMETAMHLNLKPLLGRMGH